MQASIRNKIEQQQDKYLMPKPDKYILLKQDKWLYILPILLSSLGLLFIYSASSYTANKTFGDEFYFVKKQGYAFIVGLIFMLFFRRISIEKLRKFSLPFYIVSVVLLLLVFVPVIGVENYGAKRWLNFGLFTIQPSEIAKFSLVLLLADYMSKRDMSSFFNVLVCLLFGGIMCVAIILEPNMSITVCVGLVLITMILIGGCSIKHFFLIFIPCLMLVPLMILVEPYRLERLKAFINPWNDVLGEGYQLIQSYYSLASGGLFGVGLFNSRQKYMFLPFAESDFIFAIIGEELGFVGATLVALMFLKYMFEGFKVAKRACNRFDCYLAIGITLVITFQSILNIAVVCGAIPPTGLPLPYISSGGSSLVCFLVASAILQNISFRSFSTQKFLTP